MNRQTIEIEIGELALAAPPAMLRRLAAELERELAQVITQELERRISALEPAWKPSSGELPETVEWTMNARQLSGAGIGLAVADAIWGGLSQ